MTHTEILDQFVLQGLNKGDLVEIELNSGQIITGKLSDKRIFVDEDKNGEKVKSRIGLLPPPPPPGKIYSKIVTTVYSVNIKKINRL